MMGRRRWLAVLGLATGLVLASPARADQDARQGRVANTGGENLRLRAAPKADAPIIKRLGPGWLVTILGEPSPDGHWLRVEHAGHTGYVTVGYVALVDPDGAGPSSAGTARVGRVANTGGANLRVRAAPGSEAPIVKRLGPGWRVTVLSGPVTDEAGRAWLEIEHIGVVGWVAAAYLAEA